MNVEEIWETNFPLDEIKLTRGKVRDNYDLGDGTMLMVATDRISAFDEILPTAIPGKGKVLTAMTTFWLNYLGDIVKNHLIASDFGYFPEKCRKYRVFLDGRSLLVRKLNPLPIEAIVRGYLSGSAWKEYQKNQSVCGIKLPAGLKESDKLPEILFTPSTKAEMGQHDVSLSFEEHSKILEKRLGSDLGKHIASLIRGKSIALYHKAAAYALKRGIIIADTKFEFAVDENNSQYLVLIDEVLTPDSSRFWPKDKYEPGRPQESFDKQYIRDYLESIGWNKKPPAPKLPYEIMLRTKAKYEEISRLLLS